MEENCIHSSLTLVSTYPNNVLQLVFCSDNQVVAEQCMAMIFSHHSVTEDINTLFSSLQA